MRRAYPVPGRHTQRIYSHQKTMLQTLPSGDSVSFHSKLLALAHTCDVHVPFPAGILSGYTLIKKLCSKLYPAMIRSFHSKLLALARTCDVHVPFPAGILSG